MQASSRRPIVAFACGLVVLLAGRMSSAAEPRPSWECLPEDTVAMVRVPRPAGFLEMLRARTKFGAVALGADRVRKAWELAVEAWGGTDGALGSLEEIEKQLAKHGLRPDDMQAAFAGDMGLGIVWTARGDELPPLAMALAWIEPGEEVAERMVTAFQRIVEEQADQEAPPQRVDVEMAGHPVTWVTRPLLHADLGELNVEGGMSPEQVKELQAELVERLKAAPKSTVGKMHVFVARLGGRLIAGQTLRTSSAPVRAGVANPPGDAPPAEADLDRLSGTEESRGIFERFLAAHAEDAAAPLADKLQAPGIRAALPAGEPLVEAVVDPRPVLAAEVEGNAERARMLAAVGLRDLGPIAMRVAFAEGLLRQGMFLSLPAPRGGLCRILDQECDAAEVPSFVTSETVDFTQISLDLASAYRTIKEFAVAEGGEQAANMFTTVEMQAQGWLGMELEGMLANIGSRHWILTYPSQVAAAVAEARRSRDAAGAAQPTASRLAVAWKLADDAPVLALLPKVAALAQAQVVEEQGFQGVRLPGGAAVFAGQGHLVVGLGGDATEKTLAGIRNPPAGAASLRESDVPRRAAELVELGPSRMFAVGDATRTAGMLGELRDVVAAMIPDDVAEGSRDLLAKGQRLVPPAEEMQGMFGVGATVMEANDDGIALESAWEMPAP
jgi:hypothetical protein